MGRGAISVVAFFPVSMAVGAVLGFLAGLGVGGGSLLMLWLTLVCGMEPTQARCVNLLFFLPCAVISSLFRLRQGALPLKKLGSAIALGCVAAAVGSFLCANLDTSLLRKLFGALLLVTGVRELLFRPR